MRIALLNNLFGRTARGGAETVAAQEASLLAAAGHRVTVIALAPEDGAAPPIERDGYRVIEIRNRHPFPYHGLAARGLRRKLHWHAVDVHGHGTAQAALETVAAESPDLVHTHNLMGFGFRLPRLLASAGLRHIHTVHDVQLLWPSGLLPATPWPWWLRLAVAFRAGVLRRIIGSPGAVLFPSAFHLALHNRYGFFPESRKMVLRNPAPAQASAPRSAPPEPSFLFVGQLEPHKGIFLLLEAWRRLGAQAPRLDIVGGGSGEGDVRRLAAGMDGVTVHGRKSPAEVREFCAAASFVVVPSLVIENAPTVIVEAFSVGTPAVAAASGGIPEYVEEGVTGMLFPPGDVEACVHTVRLAMGVSAEAWSIMSRSARQRSEELTSETHLSSLLSVYEKNISEAAKRI